MDEMTCPHCRGLKVATEEMCAPCHELFHAPTPETPAAEMAAGGPTFVTPRLAVSTFAGIPIDFRKLISGLMLVSIVAAVLIYGVKIAGVADAIQYRTPEQKRAWLGQKLQDHLQAINAYAATQQAKGIFQYETADVQWDKINFYIVQLRAHAEITATFYLARLPACPCSLSSVLHI